MPKAGDFFTVKLKLSHLEWGEHRHTNTRVTRLKEAYLKIPAYVAYKLEITNDKGVHLRSQEYTFSTFDGFYVNETLKASGNQRKQEFAKQFHGSGDLQLLGKWFKHINAQVNDEIRIEFVSSTELILTKI